MRTDPVTVEIIGEVLRASSEEMFVTLGRAAQSTRGRETRSAMLA